VLTPGELDGTYTCRLYSGLFPASYHNLTSSRNRKYITYRIAVRGARTEPRPQVTCTENLVKFGLKRQANRQTYRHTDHNTLHTDWDKVMIMIMMRTMLAMMIMMMMLTTTTAIIIIIIIIMHLYGAVGWKC